MSDLWNGGGQDDPIAYSRDSNRACCSCDLSRRSGRSDTAADVRFSRMSWVHWWLRR